MRMYSAIDSFCKKVGDDFSGTTPPILMFNMAIEAYWNTVLELQINIFMQVIWVMQSAVKMTHLFLAIFLKMEFYIAFHVFDKHIRFRS